jgi:hypothetical protein
LIVFLVTAQLKYTTKLYEELRRGVMSEAADEAEIAVPQMIGLNALRIVRIEQHAEPLVCA